MNGNAELLNFIYQNAQMGMETIPRLLEIAEDEKFIEHLRVELDGYELICTGAKTMLGGHGYDEKGIGTLDKVKTYLMLSMQTMNDHSAAHIAELLITGSNMGIVDGTKKLNEYAGAEPNIRELMEKLIRFEESNIESLKNFL